MIPPKVLVIDDDRSLLQMIEATLNNNGLSTICLQDGNEGYNQALKQHPDVILLDRMMPNLDGNQVLERLQADPETSKIPVIMLTAKDKVADVSESLKLGARDYIIKPFNQDNLVARIRNVIQH